MNSAGSTTDATDDWRPPPRIPSAGSSAQQVVVQLGSVTKQFTGHRGQKVDAVDGVDLSILRGELVALLGPNGAGKTTTIDMMLGLTNPSSGNLAVFGEAPHRAVAAGRVSAVLQTGGLLPDVTVEETMRLIASTFPGIVNIGAILDRVGIGALANRRVSKCSGGEQQRLKFALSLIPDPDLLILDEPTAGMDVGARREFWHQMHAEAAEGRTVIFATHYLQEADEFAERIVVMANGRVIADGPTAQIRASATSRHVSFVVDVASQADVVGRLRTIDGVENVTVVRDRVSLTTPAADDIARLILTEFEGSELEIVRGTLDDAFIALTETRVDGSSADRDGVHHD